MVVAVEGREGRTPWEFGLICEARLFTCSSNHQVRDLRQN